MKQIKNILAIAILVLFAVACTDENEFTDSKNNKNLEKSDFSPISPYPEYEKIDITDKEAMDLLYDFNKAMNKEASMPDMEVNKALLAMEMYFNYAIVDKQVNYDKKEQYPKQEFEFTVNFDGKISGNELQTKYREFLIRVKQAMSNKFLRFSDLFVSSKTESTITFKIIIPPYLLEGINDAIFDMIHIPSCPVVREVGDIPTVPNDVEIDWSTYFEGYGPYVPMEHFPYFWNNSQEILHSYCIKSLDFFVYGITTIHDNRTDDFWSTEQYYFITNLSYPSRNTQDFDYKHKFNNQEIMDYLIPTTLAEADELRQNISEGETLLDITPKLDFPYYWDDYYTIMFGGLKIPWYKTGHLIPWIELQYNMDNIVFIN
jgi:hypothetical protein